MFALLLVFTSFNGYGGVKLAYAATTWTQQTSNTSLSLYRGVYGNSTFVFVGQDTTVTRSTNNGSTWQSQRVSSGSTDDYQGVLFDGSNFMAFGLAGQVANSSDNGQTWSTSNVGASITLNGGIYAQSKYVLVGSSKNVYYSSNGTTWTNTTITNAAANEDLSAIAYGASTFVAASNQGNVYTSTDGTNWTSAAKSLTTNPINELLYINGAFFALSNGTIYRSTDGTNWTTISISAASDQSLYGISYGSSKYVVTGNNGLILTSSDLSTWVNESPGLNNADDNGIYISTFGSNKFAIGGGDGYIGTQITTASNDATLSNLAINQGTLSPTFASGTTSYSASVDYGVTSINVTPTVNQANATVKVNGNTTTSGSAQAVSLGVGSNSIPVVVTAQDGSTSQTYTINVTRAAASNNTNLSGLTPSSGTLSPTFDPSTTSYSASVANATTSITVTPTTSSTNATVTVNGTTVTSGSASGSIALAVGNNTISVVVTAQDGSTTKTYTLIVTRAAAASTDATLSGLAVSQGTLSPTFASGTTSYSVNVVSSVTSINITPTVNQANATVTVNGTTTTSGSAQTIPLAVGSNTIQVVVTAQDGSMKTYTITVIRDASTNATLSALTISAGTLSPTFSSNTVNYSSNVSNSTTSITITPTSADSTATITVNGTAMTSGSSSSSIPLAVGTNTMKVIVTAQDGNTTKTYTLDITREASSNADLNSLTISTGTLSPVFASGTTSYTASAPNTTTSITVTPTVSDDTANVTVNGSYVNSGSPSSTIALNTGTNTISIVVTAQNNSTQTYTIQVTRLQNPNLSNLTISAGTLTPTFDTNQLMYNATVGYSNSTINVTPTTVGTPQSITVAGITATNGTPTTVPLSVGSNTILIVTTMADGATQTYSVKVARNNISDQESVDADQQTLQIGYSLGDSASSVTQNLTFATNGANGTIISWITSNQAVIANDGTVTRPAYPNSDATVTITALVQKNAALTTKQFNVIVKALAITDEMAVDEDLAALQISYGAGDTANAVKQNIGLPTTGQNNTVITWSSSKPQTINPNGTVTRSTYSEGDQAVVLTATVTRNAISKTRTFDLNVKAKSASSTANLQSLVVNGQTFSPPFDPEINNYTLSVSNNTNTVTVTASTYQENATITVQGKTVARGTESDPINLSTGSNTITVIVTAQDGVTQQIYTITVNRKKKDDDTSVSGSGGDSGSGTIPTPSNPTTPTDGGTPNPTVSGFEIIVNGRQVEQIATGTKAQENGQTVFTATIDTTKLAALLAGEGTNPLVVIPVNTEADQVKAMLTGEAVELLNTQQATLRVETLMGNYTIPSTQLRIQQLAGQLGSNTNSTDLIVNVNVTASSDSVSSALATTATRDKFTVIEPPVDFDITATFNGQTSTVNQFTRYVEREIPIPDGYDPSKITTAIVVDQNGNVHHVPTAVTQINNNYFAKVNSLTNSSYALIWNPETFPDVEGKWSQSVVNDMASRLVINGVDSTHFNPNGDITRAEFAAILVRALGLSDSTASTKFSDVASSDWYSGAVNQANAYDLIDGYADGKFLPSNTITRQEAFVILNRAIAIVELQKGTGSTSLSSYSDSMKVSSWAKEATEAALSFGLVQGNGKLLNPTGHMSRAETAAVMKRLLKQAGLI